MSLGGLPLGRSVIKTGQVNDVDLEYLGNQRGKIHNIFVYLYLYVRNT